MSEGTRPQSAGRELDEKHVGSAEVVRGKAEDDNGSLVSSLDKEVFSLQSVDPALNAKMHLVNNVRGVPFYPDGLARI